MKLIRLIRLAFGAALVATACSETPAFKEMPADAGPSSANSTEAGRPVHQADANAAKAPAAEVPTVGDEATITSDQQDSTTISAQSAPATDALKDAAPEGATPPSAAAVSATATAEDTLKSIPVPIADLKTCSALPAYGKQDYGTNSKCPDNHAVVVINDGQAKELTCCPIKSPGVLSAVPSEKHIQRSGSCGSNEVVTGMIEATPVYFCTKVDSGRFKTGAPIASIYAKNDSNLSPNLLTIANSYNQRDTCICPEGGFMFGGHVTTDNVCKDTCVAISLK